MDLTPKERELIAAIQDGLPLEKLPYAAVARQVGLSEAQVIDCIRDLTKRGFIRRFGLVLSHRELGYRANAMVVWDIPDDAVGEVAGKLAALDYVTLCYRRPRRLPDWPYNLFCMIHGRDRTRVEALAEAAAAAAGAADCPHSVLFSTRQFKQRGARYAKCAAAGT
ncbi:MAG: AsnC family protein [Proteobacteria bacterium]|nr:AsnC family protein [Pseudomonadota bacterium]MCK4867392.1 AsnC family protein [Alphaproteobacteria bacterium]